MKDLKELEKTAQDNEKGTAKVQTNLSVHLRRLAKTHVDYWFSRITKRAYFDREGRKVEIPEWQIRFRKDGRQAWFNLGTPNQAAAAKKAKEIFIFTEANGWSA